MQLFRPATRCGCEFVGSMDGPDPGLVEGYLSPVDGRIYRTRLCERHRDLGHEDAHRAVLVEVNEAREARQMMEAMRG